VFNIDQIFTKDSPSAHTATNFSGD